MAHQVTVDPEQVQQQLRQLRLDIPGPDPGGPESGPEQPRPGAPPQHDPEPKGWRDESQMASMFLCGYLHGWNIPQHKQADLAEQIERVLEKWAPGGGPNIENWPPEVALLFTLGGIAVTCGVDWQNMVIKHPRPPRDDERYPQPEPDQGPGEPRAQGPAPGGGYATAGDHDASE